MSFMKPRNIQNVLSRQNWNRFTQRKLVAPFHGRTSLKLDRALKMATSGRLEETIQNQCWIQVHNLGTQDLHGSLLVMETWLVPNFCNKEALQLMAYMTQQGFEIPKRKLLNLNGNPYKYWLFRNNFEVNIAKRVPDTKMSLTYLIQHCAGKVRKPLRTVLLFLYQNKITGKPKRSCTTELDKNTIFVQEMLQSSWKEKVAQHYCGNTPLNPGSDVTLRNVNLMEKLQVDGCPKEFSLPTVNGASRSKGIWVIFVCSRITNGRRNRVR